MRERYGPFELLAAFVCATAELGGEELAYEPELEPQAPVEPDPAVTPPRPGRPWRRVIPGWGPGPSTPSFAG